MVNLPAFRIDRGIGQFDFNDYYAVLGLPVTANAGQVRKGYLTIAKKLHPDVYGRSAVEKEKASQYFSKLVNPAYHVLQQERERSEYSALLRLLAKRLMRSSQKIKPQSEVAKKLIYTPNAVGYETAISAIAQVQYECLDTILEYTAQLSELNLIYLITQEGYKPFALEATPTGSSNFGSNDEETVIQVAMQTTKSAAKSTGSAQQHMNLAEGYIAQKQWAAALKELRTALQVNNSNSKCHALLGIVYMNQKLASMAKVSFQQALKINPQEPLALQHIGKVDTTASKTDAQSKAKDSSKKGGFFGWLS